MKLYTAPPAPNPRRIQIFLAEKGVEVPTQLIDLGKGEQFEPAFVAVNPESTVPALVLDDGTAITESIAICRTIEALHPDPPLFGADAREQGLVEMWNRKLELGLYLPMQDAFRNSRPRMADRALPGVRSGVPAIPELIGRSSATARRTLARLDAVLAGRAFVIGPSYSMADIVGLTAIEFGKRTKMEAVAELSDWPHVERWYASVSARPSAST